ncbi:polyamine aminopropyltransferase [Desulfotruncus alcoholivorax]|uniref:polyamine aminopropyltransferase n=1 Tax=Desulfotruncus alcoholivorax TaxID=265477 RepID=UPI0003FED8DB|nr:polyamine aminopropyltransferase [Desulfotruncus alcoholivorax]
MNISKWITRENGELWLTEEDRDNLKISYRVKEIIHEEQSPFQHIMIVDLFDFGPSLILDGVVQTTSLDGHIYNEMISHIPLVTHPNPKKVLIIGGGDCGAAREAAKYKEVERIDMVEIDEAVVRLCKQYMPEVSGNLSDPRVNFIFADGIEYVKTKQNEYDVIIIDSSDPVGPAVGLFHQEFYAGAKKALKQDGIIVCQSESPLFYMQTLNNTRASLKGIFQITRTYLAVVPTYPGGFWSFTLASDKHDPLTWRREWDKEAKYVSEGIIKSCFVIPGFILNKLDK